MRQKKKNLRPLRTSPAQNLARAAVTRLLAEGRCVVSADQLAETANISGTTARAFIKAGRSVGLFQDLKERIPVALHSSHVVMTEKFPGAPTADTITLSALMYVAHGTGVAGAAAFAYHTALALHGLSEVASTGIYVIKIRHSIRPPSLPGDVIYEPKDRLPREWMRLADRQPVWLTLRSADQVPNQDVVTVTREQMPLPVTSELRTLIDAWMHPGWCGGEDRVADSWRMYWRKQNVAVRRAELSALLVGTTWPGLWRPLSRWASEAVPALDGFTESTERAAQREQQQ